MKQFNLVKYLENPNQKIITKDGKSVRIICTDRESSDFPIVALIKFRDREGVFMYSLNGQCCDTKNTDLDLFFVSKEKVCPFKFGDKVLVRDSDTSWRFDTFSCYRENSDYPYMCIYAPYEQCIPLNEHTWNLLGTTDEYKEETTD